MEFSRPEYGVGSLSLLQGIFPTQGLSPGLPYFKQILYQLSHKGSPRILEWAAYPFSSRSSRPYAFLVVMYGCESWTVKKTERWRIDAFELWFWRRLLRVPWTARRSNQSILKKISPECSLEGLMLKLKPQYFGHLIRRTDPFEKTLMLGKIEGGRRRGWQDEMLEWHHRLNGHEFELVPGVGDRQTGKPGMLQSMGWQRVGHNWVTELNRSEC